MGAYLYIPWFKLDQWDVPLPHLVGIVLALSALAALNPKWRSSALSTVVTACGAAAVAWFFFDVQEVPIQPFGVLVATGVRDLAMVSIRGDRRASWACPEEHACSWPCRTPQKRREKRRTG